MEILVLFKPNKNLLHIHNVLCSKCLPTVLSVSMVVVLNRTVPPSPLPFLLPYSSAFEKVSFSMYAHRVNIHEHTCIYVHVGTVFVFTSAELVSPGRL